MPDDTNPTTPPADPQDSSGSQPVTDAPPPAAQATPVVDATADDTLTASSASLTTTAGPDGAASPFASDTPITDPPADAAAPADGTTTTAATDTAPAAPQPPEAPQPPPVVLPIAPPARPVPGWLSLLILLAIAIAAVLPSWLRSISPGRQPNAAAATLGYIASHLKQGELPLWNPWVGLGQPLLGDGQTPAAHPVVLLHLFCKPIAAWLISAVLHLWLAGVGAWLLARRFHLRDLPRLLTAGLFMLCGFNVLHVNQSQGLTIIWLPWAILVLIRLIERPTLLRLAIASLVFAIQFLGGHPGASLHLLLACALAYVLLPLRVRPGALLKAAPLAVAAVFIGFCIAGVQWIPMIDYLGNSPVTSSLQDRVHSSVFAAMNLKILPGLVSPYLAAFFTGATQASLGDNGLGVMSAAQDLSGAWIGTAGLLLAALGIATHWRRGEARYWIVAGTLSLLLAMRLPLLDLPLRWLPGLAVASTGPLLAMAALSLAMLAGFGVQSLADLVGGADPLPRLRRRLSYAAVGIAGLAVLAIIVVFATRSPIIRSASASIDAVLQSQGDASPAQPFAAAFHTQLLILLAQLLIPAIIIAAAAGLLWWRLKKPAAMAARSPWLWSALAAVELLALAIPHVPSCTQPADAGAAPALATLSQKLAQSPNDSFRILGRRQAFAPAAAINAGLQDLRGANRVLSWRLVKWLEAVDGAPQSPAGGSPTLAHVDRPAARLLNLQYLIATSQPAAPWKSASAAAPSTAPSTAPADASTIAIYENTTALPRMWFAGRAAVPPGGNSSTPWYEKLDDLLPHVAAMDFDPAQVVLLDQGVSRLMKDWVRELNPLGTAGKSVLHPDIEYLDITPERLHMKIRNGGGGWLVIANAYANGWVAKIDPRYPGTPPVGKIVLPAYGVLQTIPLPEGIGSEKPLELLVEYKPICLRRGVFFTAGGGIALLLLLGCSFFRWQRDEVDATLET